MISLSAGAKEMLNKMNALARQIGLGTLLGECAAKSGTLVKTGVGAGSTIDLGVIPASIVCVQAFVTATGAPATKALLALTTDYTVVLSTGILTCVGNQSANTLVITYT
jgi:hypothetical protein